MILIFLTRLASLLFDKRMIEQLLCLRAELGFFCQHFLDEVLDLCRYCDGLWELGLLLDYAHQVALGFYVERVSAD